MPGMKNLPVFRIKDSQIQRIVIKIAGVEIVKN